MLLKELTIHGFKSFAKKSELAFPFPITAIVGPNGSGKSNVAESFKFVLGEQSISRMRGKKGEDLIFGGSEKMARLGRAVVTAVFDNTRKIFPVDFDELIVERTVSRDGTSEYLINGTRVRLKDVVEILAAANIGTTGHHIIAQGEADRILTASPKLRREMIEDALGLRVYQYKIMESRKKLEKTRENSDRVESLRRETIPHLQFLERQVKKYEKAIELREDLSHAFAEYLRSEKAYIEISKQRIRTQIAEPKASLQKLTKTKADAVAKIDGQTRHEDEGELSIHETELIHVRTDLEAAVHADGALEGQIGFLERRIQHVRARHDEESRAGERLSPIPYDVFTNAYAQMVRAIEHALSSTSLEETKHVLQNIQTTLTGLTNRTDRGAHRTLDLSEEEKELRELRTKKNETNAVVRKLHERAQVLEHQCAILKEKITVDTEEVRELRHKVELYTHEIRDVERVIESLTHKGIELDRDEEAMNAEVREAVVLVQSRAMQYMKHAIIVDGKELSDEEIALRPREEQYEIKRNLERLKIRMEELGGVNEEVIREYKNAKDRDEFLDRELSDLRMSAESLEKMILELNQELSKKFTEGLQYIDDAFNRFFARMFVGGTAHVMLTYMDKGAQDTEDEEVYDDVEDSRKEEEREIGVEIDVRLPNKRVRGLDMLSGGERALTSIALVFAMSQINPPPFIILDETDAALDEANSRRYGDALQILAEKSQLILITHNRETMSRASILYGITMGADGCSRMLSIKLDDALAVAK